MQLWIPFSWLSAVGYDRVRFSYRWCAFIRPRTSGGVPKRSTFLTRRTYIRGAVTSFVQLEVESRQPARKNNEGSSVVSPRRFDQNGRFQLYFSHPRTPVQQLNGKCHLLHVATTALAYSAIPSSCELVIPGWQDREGSLPPSWFISRTVAYVLLRARHRE